MKAIILFICVTGIFYVNATSINVHRVTAQDDTVKAYECLTPPVIDGMADDACWEQAQWQAIDAEWIVWGQDMEPADFSGRYTVSWSSATDRMYFLVEVTDDVQVKGYHYPASGWWNWDGIEIFFDEDASGGDHQYNQNAFAYHITEGNSEVGYEAVDLTTEGRLMNYSDHFECQIRNSGVVYIWELSMIVYNESYDPDKVNNPVEQLEIGRICGLTMAYNDNDNPNENPKERDNFIGSVEVPEQNSNDHWINASWFGKVKLLESDNPSAIKEHTGIITELNLKNYPNPFNSSTTIEYTLFSSDYVSLTVYDIQGKEIVRLVDSFQKAGNYQIQFDGSSLASGIYFIKLKSAQQIKTIKMVLSE